MDTLERLIAQSRKLEETASQIQDGTRIGLPAEKIEIFIQAYRDWYAECLSILPYAQKSALQREFKGSEYNPQIREFLASPTELWPVDGQ